ncbi:SGNH/GDSL hydrolase family protein [Actinoallomurus sp. NBC_01490]|uniref:SGNH/GDSL hydrolase family protein n=1 Tax=Actinoallomurus sp. NBC_01490 TaxID=2903557 RepID=UPI002E350C2E|nr:SGNH/GDSL hydrolase family protein [Actinoallomurus sp. NBC_01490]
MAVVWRRIRTRRGALVALPLALVLLAAVVAVPIGVSRRCRIFGQGCRAPHIRLKPPPRALTPLEAATRGGYVALGDSYSSGEGAWSPSADRAYANGGAEDCHRSRQSYFPTVSQAYRFAKAGGFWACSGARTENLLNTGERGEPPQIDRLAADTSLVTLSIGGNDIGFSQIVQKCVVKLPWSSACRDQNTDIRTRMAALPGSLRSVLDGIARRAPYARVLVLGYPRPFPVRPQRSIDNIGTADQGFLNGIVHDLDYTIYLAARDADRRLAAARKPGSVEFVDTYQAFTGHELGTAQPYLNALDLSISELVAARSFHPNSLGYQKFGELMNRQIQAGPGRQIYQWGR